MVQPERPPDTSLAVQRTLRLQRTPTVLHEREPAHFLSDWGFLQYTPDAFSDTFSVVLGFRYTLDELEELHFRAHQPWDYTPSPDDEMVMRLLKMNPADRRMTYRAELAREIHITKPLGLEPASQEHMLLEAELRAWGILDRLEMQAKLGSGLEHRTIDEHLKDERACWKWVREMEPKYPYPTTPSWRRMKHVNVHRLLWPIVRPTQPFTLGVRTVRNPMACATKTCVNPWHFVDPSTVQRRSVSGSGRGHPSAVRSAYRIRWHEVPDVKILDDGSRQLICPNCKEPAPYHYQEIVNRPLPVRPRTGIISYCPTCYVKYKVERDMYTTPYALRMPDLKRGETAAERAQHEFERAQDPNDGWPEWSYPERNGQDEDE